MSAPQDVAVFLAYTVGQKEAALVIVDSEHGLLASESALAAAGFTKAAKPLPFLKSVYQRKRPYIVLNEKNAKDMYDICQQYPTGQITFLNRSKMATVFVRPDYNHSAIVLVTTAAMLKILEKKGLSFRSITGLTCQA